MSVKGKILIEIINSAFEKLKNSEEDLKKISPTGFTIEDFSEIDFKGDQNYLLFASATLLDCYWNDNMKLSDWKQLSHIFTSVCKNCGDFASILVENMMKTLDLRVVLAKSLHDLVGWVELSLKLSPAEHQGFLTKATNKFKELFKIEFTNFHMSSDYNLIKGIIEIIKSAETCKLEISEEIDIFVVSVRNKFGISVLLETNKRNLLKYLEVINEISRLKLSRHTKNLMDFLYQHVSKIAEKDISTTVYHISQTEDQRKKHENDINFKIAVPKNKSSITLPQKKASDMDYDKKLSKISKDLESLSLTGRDFIMPDSGFPNESEKTFRLNLKTEPLHELIETFCKAEANFTDIVEIYNHSHTGYNLKISKAALNDKSVILRECSMRDNYDFNSIANSVYALLISAKFPNPFFTQVFFCFVTEKSIVLVTEYFELSLCALIDHHRSINYFFEESYIFGMIKNLSDSLLILEINFISHSRLESKKIMINCYGEMKLIGFSKAKVYVNANQEGLKAFKNDIRNDVKSAGMLIYEMVSHEKLDRKELRKEEYLEDRLRLIEYPWLQNLLRKMMTPQADQRIISFKLLNDFINSS